MKSKPLSAKRVYILGQNFLIDKFEKLDKTIKDKNLVTMAMTDYKNNIIEFCEYVLNNRNKI